MKLMQTASSIQRGFAAENDRSKALKSIFVKMTARTSADNAALIARDSFLPDFFVSAGLFTGGEGDEGAFHAPTDDKRLQVRMIRDKLWCLSIVRL